MVLRIVAAETPKGKRRAMVRDPAGSAVWTYDSITASSTLRSGSESSEVIPKSCIASNLATNGSGGQARNDLIEPEPTRWSESDPPPFPRQPSLAFKLTGGLVFDECRVDAIRR